MKLHFSEIDEKKTQEDQKPKGIEGLGKLLAHAWRLRFDWDEKAVGAAVTVPMLRGVWGAALHDQSALWHRFFFGDGGDIDHGGSAPRYLIRPALVENHEGAFVDFLLFGDLPKAAESFVWSAWQEACQRGLGPNRAAFRLVQTIPLDVFGNPDFRPEAPSHFPLHPLPWPLGSLGGPCHLEFPEPIRLLERGSLIEFPTLPDLTIACIRRIRTLDTQAAAELWETRGAWLSLARAIPHGLWQGGRRDLVRYSGTQKREIQLRAVQGSLFLPKGPGALAPLLAAALWTHLGKGVVMGMGRPILKT